MRIPDFEDWYEGWRAIMRADPGMVWVVDSRNRVVKQGDLQLHSTAAASIVLNYLDVVRLLENDQQPSRKIQTEPIQIPLVALPAEALAQLDEAGVPEVHVNDALLAIERRWVDKEMPSMELLDATAHAYGVLSTLIGDAHDRLGIGHAIHIGETVLPEDLQPKFTEGRLPCMVTTRKERTLFVALGSGEITEALPTRSHVSPPPGAQPPPEVARRLRRRYGRVVTGLSPPPAHPDTIHDLAGHWMDMAKAMLKKDGGHGWYIFYYKGLRRVSVDVLAARGMADKMMLAADIADKVRVMEYDGLATIGEIWMGAEEFDGQGGLIRPELQANRKEGLLVFTATADGACRSLATPFYRRFGLIQFRETIEDKDFEHNLLKPTLEVWREWGLSEEGRH